MNLAQLKIGQKAKIISLDFDNKETRRHLLDMGLTRGTKVEIKKIAPMGDPVDLKLRDYELCIGKSDLNKIQVEVIK